MLANTSPAPVCALWAVCVLNVPQASESGKNPNGQYHLPFSLSQGAVGFEELTHYLLLFGSIIGKGVEGKWMVPSLQDF